MEDEHEADEKSQPPVDELSPYYDSVAELEDLARILRDQIDHFLRHNKEFEKGNWVKVIRWVDRDGARKLIIEAIDRCGKV